MGVTERQPHRVVFHDCEAKRMPGARCRVFENGQLINKEDPYADPSGCVTVQIRQGSRVLELEWAPSELPEGPEYPYRRQYYLVLGKGEQGVRRRLHNIGFSAHPTLEENVRDFQRAYLQRPTGRASHVARTVADYHDKGLLPPIASARTRTQPKLENRDAASNGDANDVVAAGPPSEPGPGPDGVRPQGAAASTNIKMIVGFSYPWAYNKYGLNFGPRSVATTNPLDGSPGGWSKTLPTHLEKLANLKVRIMRWFIMANCANYGSPPQEVESLGPGGEIRKEWRFDPPPSLDRKFIDDFEIALEAFRTFNEKNPERKILFLPVWVDFGMTLPYGHGGAGRADCLTNPKKRDHFLKTVLDEFLKTSARYDEHIWAWEVMNEPYWSFATWNPLVSQSVPDPDKKGETKEVVPLIRVTNPLVDRSSMRTFLADAIKHIEAHGFESTVGHRFFDDMRWFPTGSFPQYHYYARNFLGFADPAEVPRQSDAPIAFLGEMGTGDHGDPWPELKGADNDVSACTYARLKALEAKGHRIVLIWPSGGGPPAATHDAFSLGRDQCASLAKYTGGSVP
jgi:hypothetical protein